VDEVKEALSSKCFVQMLMTLKAAIISEMKIMKLIIRIKSLLKTEKNDASTQDREVLSELESENKPFLSGK